ncbi:3-octaprenyl-4-hydroxybenzoate carboxy-lyase [Streptomyces carminius]|uniref:3-octaprenyl-4-hydroxybenzoate carboxy-lyase n=1 Tax=Streptomyces carminius TaxID=2665496 RepID=A0A2M8LZL9_9ACTN|nr:UbiD family decarboxylase [Streptomyces carminius]PJE97394.1 3-octaprenyl-4-hydroxybenzoate carboxy-lyase [Streptomyces carminius]
MTAGGPVGHGYPGSGLTRASGAARLGLPPCYDAVGLYTCDTPLSSRVEVARTLADIERAHGARPTVVFTRITEHPGSRVLGHPYPRAVLLAALSTTEEKHLAEMSARLAGPEPTHPGQHTRQIPPTAHRERLSGLLDDLPVLQHRPGDAGPYITAGIGVTSRPDGGGVNLGFYRIQVTGPDEARIFLDPRTDGHRNLLAWLAAGRPMPISVFLGADPAVTVVAASRLPAEGDDYAVASRLLGRPLVVTGTPPVPCDATHVVTGLVQERDAVEGPFGEFKGYYAEARRSNVLTVTGVEAVPGAPFPTIVAGAESGLTLMGFQNEYLMYAHLRGLGYEVGSVRYSLRARGEFVAYIESDAPSQELVRDAMAFDIRSKVIICGPDLANPGQALATHGFLTRTEPYYRKGRVEGERVGLALMIRPEGRPTEY